MSILVITPTLGSSAHLPAAIESIRAVALGRDVLPLIVASAGASPGLRATVPGVSVVEERGRGLYSAVNTGLGARLAPRWEWFTCLNDDDLWERGMARALDEAASRDKRPGIIYGRTCLMDRDSRRLGQIPVARHPDDLLPLLRHGIVPLAQPGTLIHREVVDRLGGFDASYRSAGDLDFFVRALVAGFRFSFVNEMVAAFRIHAGQISKDERTADAEKARVLRMLEPGSWCRRILALSRFRAVNLAVYAERVRRLGFVRMKEIYRRP